MKCLKMTGCLLAGLLAGCGLYDAPEVTTWRDAEKPLLVGHRGSRGEYDDNALGGFRLVLAQGIRGFETDVRLTADDELVIMHDSKVERTTNGTGKVGDMTLAQVRALRLKKCGEQVPTPADLAMLFRGRRDLRVEFEMKEQTDLLGAERGETYCRKLHDTVAAVMEPGAYVFTSFHADTLATMRRLYPDAPLSFITAKPCTRELIDQAVALGCLGFAPLTKNVTPEMIAYAHAKGLYVSLWMVQNAEEYAHVKELGADTCTSDYPMTVWKSL